MEPLSRRTLLTTAALTGAAVVAPPSVALEGIAGGRAFGVLPEVRLKNQSARAASAVIAETPDERHIWAQGPVLDQRNTQACVGFAWTAELTARPFADRKVDPKVARAYAFDHYRRARELGGLPLDVDSGCFMSDGADVAVERGLIESWVWAETAEDVRNALAEGPVVIALGWRQSMVYTKPTGLIPVRGRYPFGGHAVTVTGYDPARVLGGRAERVFRLRNSFGRAFGRHPRGRSDRGTGSGWIRYDDLDRLLAEEGFASAVVPLGRKPVDLARLIGS